jgi:hypothetical protein
MANALEALWQHMQQEAGDELCGGQCDHSPSFGTGWITEVKGK